ncbi:hypothetical protein BJ742DRAFT_422833 [Cladochytrium replicatum]|nr:hypothetical protein BJ742DRAFT_422833 [Cladochytrium replicatum]
MASYTKSLVGFVSAFSPNAWMRSSSRRTLLVPSAAVLVCYVAIVRVLRYRNRNKIRLLAARVQQRKLDGGVKPRKKGDPLLSKEEDEILKLMTYDFPTLYNLSFEFALFKTYTSPTISALLHKTGEFRRNAEKRAEDTSLLLREGRENAGIPDRSNPALRRINEIHAHYRITNDDMLYTLSLFMMEPPRWISMYGFRPIEEGEIEANFQYHRAMGEEMNIKDIPETFEAVKEWAKDYEAKHVVYSEYNRKVADTFTDLLLKSFATFLHPMVNQIVMGVLEPEVRSAFNYPDPTPFVSSLVQGTLRFSGWFTRVFLPPRILDPRRTSPQVGKNGMYRSLWSPFPNNMYGMGYRVDELGPAFKTKTEIGDTNARITKPNTLFTPSTTAK